MTPYNYGSVMHYGPTYFALNRSAPTIIPTKNASAFIGQRIGLSPIDILEIQRYYNCLLTPSTQNDTTMTSTSMQTTTNSTTTTTDAVGTMKNMITATTSFIITRMSTTTTPFSERITITTTVDGMIILGGICNAFHPLYIVCWISVVYLWNIHWTLRYP